MAQQKWLLSEGPKIIDVDLVRRLKVGLIAGQVNILGHDESHARLEVHSVSGRELKVTVDGDTLEIDHPQLRWDNFIEVFKSFKPGNARADISLTVPRDIALTLGVISASALVSGLTEDATLSTVSGDITVDGVYGDLQLNAVSGELAVRNHYGRIAAHTISGDITASGEVAKFTADTVSGDVFLDLTGIPDEVNINTVSGSVTTRLEGDTPVKYRINTVSGRIQLDRSGITGVRGAFEGSFGTLEERWLDFKTNTVSGNVSVLHEVRA